MTPWGPVPAKHEDRPAGVCRRSAPLPRWHSDRRRTPTASQSVCPAPAAPHPIRVKCTAGTGAGARCARGGRDRRGPGTSSGGPVTELTEPTEPARSVCSVDSVGGSAPFRGRARDPRQEARDTVRMPRLIVVRGRDYMSDGAGGIGLFRRFGRRAAPPHPGRSRRALFRPPGRVEHARRDARHPGEAGAVGVDDEEEGLERQ